MDYGTRYMARKWAQAEEYRKTAEYKERERLMTLAAHRAEAEVEAAFPEGPSFDNARSWSKYHRERVAYWQKCLGVGA